MHPTVSPSEQALLAALEDRVNTLLPPQYQFSAGPVNPQSMGSARLKFGPDGRAAWDEIWTSFCDLALAGGPPHRGTLLEAPTPEEVLGEPAGYQLVSEEIARGIRLTTNLEANPAAQPGWVEVRCRDEGMASWLLRAVMAENVFARQQGELLSVPAGPQFQLARETKNVVVALAKTCHYWDCHLSAEQRQGAAVALREAAGSLLLPASRPEILPRAAEYRTAADQMARQIAEATGLPAAPSAALGWVGVRFPDERTAAWFIRSAIASDILARREEETLHLPVPSPAGEIASCEAVTRLAQHTLLWGTLRQSS